MDHSEDLNWKIFFEENSKPSHFDENVKLIFEVCQQAAIKKHRVALVTVSSQLSCNKKLYNCLKYFFLFPYSLVEPQFLWSKTQSVSLTISVLEQEDLLLQNIF
jgi:hypothetical protein